MMRESIEYQKYKMEKINHLFLNNEIIVKSEPVEVGEVAKSFEEHHVPIKKLCYQGNAINLSTPARISALGSVEKCIKLGETFKSFGEVSQAITMYEMKHKVSLTQKYFRRIAANPKPSNIEDSMLSEEERKRFVFRWVDFCCTYFDDMLARSDPVDRDSTETNQVIGLAMKECPMRIRFQLRFNEKDLMISIFKETHDHVHPGAVRDDGSQESTLLENNADNIVTPTAVDRFSDPVHPKRQPPSLAPISALKFKSGTPCVPTRLQSNSNSDGYAHSTVSPQNLRTQLQSQNSLTIPKPPPLKAMPLLCNQESSNAGPNNTLSAENIIRNIYLHLCRLHATGTTSNDNGLRFTTSNPDLIKITSDLSGVDESRISTICRKRKPQGNSSTSSEEKVKGRSPPQTSCLNMPIRERISITKRSMVDTLPTLTHVDSNTPQESSSVKQPQFVDHHAKTDFLSSLPLEVIIKSEPDDTIDFYDENDSSEPN